MLENKKGLLGFSKTVRPPSPPLLIICVQSLSLDNFIQVDLISPENTH